VPHPDLPVVLNFCILPLEHFLALAAKINLISANLPQNTKSVIPEALLVGIPASNRPKSWIPDKDVRG
jgi:hypothetical protein